MSSTETRVRGHDAGLSYHGTLLGDPVRMDAYERALRDLVGPGDVVLDLGCGSGVLAMLAARAGAERVHAVESMPIANMARRLVADNGLSDRVLVHQADIVEMAPIETVDLIVSDFMGRFVVDDDMLLAVDAAAKWLAPGGRFCPSTVDMMVAPVAMGHFAPLDVFEAPINGLDVSAAGAMAHRYCYGVELEKEAALAPALRYHRLTPPAPPGPFDAQLSFQIARPGRLRGLACWFEAELAPGITLQTGPGTNTHWSQILLPLPATRVEPGDCIALRLWMPPGGVLEWCWQGTLSRDGEPLHSFDLEAVQHLTKPPPGPSRQAERLDRKTVMDLDEEAAQAAASGDLDKACAACERALLGLRDEDADLAAHLNGNLGGLYTMMGRFRSAIGPLMRCLDGDMANDEQAARLLVDGLFRSDLANEGVKALQAYEEAHGPHASGWRPSRHVGDGDDSD